MKHRHIKLETALGEIKRRSLDGLIIYSNGTCNILGPKYIYYFAEFRPLGSRNAVVITKDGLALALVEPAWDAGRVQMETWIDDVRGTAQLVTDLGRVMDAANMTGRVGIVGAEEMTEDVFAGIEQKADLEMADDIVTTMAARKTPEDIAKAEKAGRIADIGFMTLLQTIRVGMREYELLAEIENAMRCAGADDIFNFMSSEKHNEAMHNPTDKRFLAGDIVIAEITAGCRGQFVQVCKTVTIGQPDPVLVEKYNLLLAALEKSLNCVRPGVPASQISVTMNKVIGEAGYGKYCYPPYMRARGHGIGVGSVAPGQAIDDETQGLLEKDQVVVVHPNQYLPETGYLACGETVIVTDTGFKRLSEIEFRLYSKEI